LIDNAEVTINTQRQTHTKLISLPEPLKWSAETVRLCTTAESKYKETARNCQWD